MQLECKQIMLDSQTDMKFFQHRLCFLYDCVVYIIFGINKRYD